MLNQAVRAVDYQTNWELWGLLQADANRFVISILRNYNHRYEREQVEDLVGEVMITFVEQNGETCLPKCKSYLFILARCAVIDGFRKRGVETPLEDLMERGFDPIDKRDSVNVLINRLQLDRMATPAEKPIITHILAGHNYTAISGYMGVHRSTLWRKVQRIRTRMNKAATPAVAREVAI